MKGQNKKSRVGRLGVVVVICLTMIMTSAITAVSTSMTYSTGNISDEMSYSFDFNAPVLQTISCYNTDFTTIDMQGCLAVGTQDGNPMMPVDPVMLMLPPQTTVSQLDVVGTPVIVPLSGTNLLEKPICPQQKSVPIGSDVIPDFSINSAVYTSNAVYPATTRTDYTVGYSHGYAILSFCLNPIQYNPVQGTLMYYPQMTVRITLQSTDVVNPFYSNSPEDAAYVKTLVLNPDIADLYPTASLPVLEYPGGLCDPGHHYDYVIITTTQNGLDYWDTTGSTPYNWESLLAEHAADGLSGTVVTVQDIYACSDYYLPSPFNDTRAHIREFIKDAYEDWGTRYVLIGGDSDTIPARQLYYSYEGNVDSDLYWSNLDNDFNNDHDTQWGEAGDTGFDLYSEIAIGRITCDTPQDVSNWLTKSLFYASSSDDEYLDNAGFYGGNTGWDCQGDDFMDYSAIKGTDDWLGPDPDYDGPFPAWAGFQFGFETWNANHEGNQFNISVRMTAAPSPNPGWSGAGVQGLRDAINNDQVTIISGIAHADNQMSLDVYDSDWENPSLYHNTMPFFLHDYGCHCGDFDASDDGVIESMLFHSDTYLAFACIYNTGYGWGNFETTNSSSAFETKQFWNYFLNMENYSGDYSNWQFGIGHAWAKDTMAPTIDWDSSSGTWRGVIECCLLFGDPAQMFKTPHPSQSPTKPSKPVGRTLGIWHQEYSYTSTSTDPDGDQIFYLFDWGDGTTSGWVGPYSSAQAGTASHIWTELGTYYVRVKARDVWGAGSIWSDGINVTITDNTPPTPPAITGPSQGKPGGLYGFSFQSVDAQDQEVCYYVDWGDGTNTSWCGPYVNGTMIHLTHAFATKGAYNVSACAKDSMDSVSDWAVLTFQCPYKFTPLASLLEWLFARFPNAFPLLRQLLGYA